MNRHVHIEVTGIKGDIAPIHGIATPPRFRIFVVVDGRRRSLSGVCQFNGLLYAFSRIAEMTAAVHSDIVAMIRAMWRDLRILFTGYWTGYVEGYREQREVEGPR